MADSEALKRTKEIGVLLRRFVDQVQPIVDQLMVDVVQVDQGLPNGPHHEPAEPGTTGPLH